MSRLTRRLFIIGSTLGAVGCTTAEQEAVLGAVLGGTSGTGGLTTADAVAGIKAALDNGVAAAVTQVGRTDGYFRDGKIHIPLPGRLSELQSNLSRFGLSGLLDDLELQLNRGAEIAAPAARSIFLDTIRSMSVSDAIGIVRGHSTAATDYFKDRTTPQLTALFRPIMVSSLQKAGAIQTFDNLIARLDAIPLAPQLGQDAKDDLIDHGIERGLDGLFYYIAQEEAAIRANPAKRTSEILRKVFG